LPSRRRNAASARSKAEDAQTQEVTVIAVILVTLIFNPVQLMFSRPGFQRGTRLAKQRTQ
jgi:hypothetical protein